MLHKKDFCQILEINRVNKLFYLLNFLEVASFFLQDWRENDLVGLEYETCFYKQRSGRLEQNWPEEQECDPDWRKWLHLRWWRAARGPSPPSCTTVGPNSRPIDDNRRTSPPSTTSTSSRRKLPAENKNRKQLELKSLYLVLAFRAKFLISTLTIKIWDQSCL